MLVVRWLVIFFIFIGKSMASQCGLADFEEVICEKSVRVKSFSELNAYLVDYAAVDGVAKNLLIDFDINTTEDLNIHSPCKIKIKKFKSIQVNNLCINGLEGVYFQNNVTLNAQDVSLFSNERVAIRHHANITANNLSLNSVGVGLTSRVHIRHNSTINVKNLSLSADARATLGHSSTYNIEENLNMSSNIEFSAIWKNSTVSAKSATINSNRKIRLSKGVSLNSEVMDLSSPECSTKNLTTTGAEGGNCFVEGRPVARLSGSAKVIDAGGASVL